MQSIEMYLLGLAGFLLLMIVISSLIYLLGRPEKGEEEDYRIVRKKNDQ